MTCLLWWQSLGSDGHPESTPSCRIGNVCECSPPLGEWSGQAEWMRFARLIHRPVRAFGRPRPGPPAAAVRA
jgi:hypothetical protein